MHLRLQRPVLHLLTVHRDYSTRCERLKAEGTGRGIAQLRAAQAEVGTMLHGQEKAQKRSPRDATAHPAQVHQAVVKACMGSRHQVSPKMAG